MDMTRLLKKLSNKSNDINVIKETEMTEEIENQIREIIKCSVKSY